jgi:hypothetical protein
MQRRITHGLFRFKKTMSLVNIDDNLFVSCGLKLKGELKRTAQDFRVTELHDIIADNNTNAITIKPVSTGLKVKEEKSDSWDGLVGDPLIKEIVGAANLKLISDTNHECQRALESVQSGGKCSELESIYLLLPRGTSKLHRGLLHTIIKEGYPFLMTASMTSEECLQVENSDDNNINDNEVTVEEYEENHHSTAVTGELLDSFESSLVSAESSSSSDLSSVALAGIRVSPDWSLIELCHTSLSMADITAIYAYKNCGSYHKDAGYVDVHICTYLIRCDRICDYHLMICEYLFN